jgi:hypothetical protein
MRKGFLAILLALVMAFGMTMTAEAYDNLAEPSVGFVVPWVIGDSAGGLDTVVGVYDTPDDLAAVGLLNPRVITWTFFRASDSAHILDNDFLITAGQLFPFSWNAQKGNNLDGVDGYLVFADPFLSTTTLTANALQVRGLIVAAYVPVLQLRGGRFIGIDNFFHSLDGYSCAQQDLVDQGWINRSQIFFSWDDTLGPGAAVTGPPFFAAFDPGENYNVRAEVVVPGGVPGPAAGATGVWVDLDNDAVVDAGEVFSQIPEIRTIGADPQIFVSPNTAWNGIQLGDIVIPRFSGGPANPSLSSRIAIWKPDTQPIGGTVQFWNTLTEANVSLQFGSNFELVLLDPYDTAILGNPNFPEGAVEFRNAPLGWPTPGGIVFTLVDGIVGGAIAETQTLLAPHYDE